MIANESQVSSTLTLSRRHLHATRSRHVYDHIETRLYEVMLSLIVNAFRPCHSRTRPHIFIILIKFLWADESSKSKEFQAAFTL